MTKQLLKFLVVLLWCAQFAQLAIAESPDPQPEALYYGSAISAAGTPIAFVHILSADGPFSCTGVVIQDETVLTAGHCLDKPGISNITIVTADNVFAYAVHYGIHPSYYPLTEYGPPFMDLAYIKLDRRLPKIVKLAALSKTSPKIGEALYMYGYGLDENGVFGFLKTGQMRTAAYTSVSILALRPPGGSHTCLGDSGGPAFVLQKGMFKVVGLDSFRRGDCSTGIAGLTALQSNSAKAFIKTALKRLKKKK